MQGVGFVLPTAWVGACLGLLTQGETFAVLTQRKDIRLLDQNSFKAPVYMRVVLLQPETFTLLTPMGNNVVVKETFFQRHLRSDVF